MAESKDYISKPLEHGCVYINEDVLVTIATTAIREVEGVVLPVKKGKGIRVELGESSVRVECNLTLLYGHPVVDIAKNVQSAVSAAIESMAGLSVSSVDVTVAGVVPSKA